MRRSRTAAVVAALALATPGAALAQSAGDDQYQDPFAGEDESRTGGGSNGDGSADDTTGASGGAPTSSPPPVPAAPAAETAAAAPTGATLPRTGRDAEWVLALGLLLLAAGVGLRRGVSAARP